MPGTTYLPFRSSVRTPAGDAPLPIVSMRPLRRTIVASADTLPSRTFTRLACTSAKGSAGVDAGACAPSVTPATTADRKAAAFVTSARRHHRDHFDFEQQFRPDQPLDFDERARRRGLAEILRANVTDGLHLGHVGDVAVHLHDIRELRACRRQRRFEVPEHLLGLRLHVARSDDVAVLVECDLAG